MPTRIILVKFLFSNFPFHCWLHKIGGPLSNRTLDLHFYAFKNSLRTKHFFQPLCPQRASLMAQLVKKILLQCERPGFDPWVGKISWRGERLPTPVFSLENSMDCIAHGVTKSRTRLSGFTFFLKAEWKSWLNTQYSIYWDIILQYKETPDAYNNVIKYPTIIHSERN